MDTIFVKNVKEDGPAHQAGLRTGERHGEVAEGWGWGGCTTPCPSSLQMWACFGSFHAFSADFPIFTPVWGCL